MTDQTIYVGLRREDKSSWERRTPLPPHTCKEIMEKHPQIKIVVQPCTKRIFPVTEYEKVGCLIDEDLSKCEIIVCIKEIPLNKYIPGKTYLHWSHTIKGQPDNMPALDRMLELKVRHFDYEKILDDKGNNFTAFPFAGTSGAIMFLSEYGKWLLKRGINNPFLSIGPPYQYFHKAHCYSQMREVAKVISEIGLSDLIGLPLTIGVLGSTGKCGQGTMEALQNLPITILHPKDLKAVVEDRDNPKHRYTIYVVPFRTQDLVEDVKDPGRIFESKEYYEHPHHFAPVFHERYLPYLSLIINDIYWDHKFPRYVTNHQLRDLVQQGRSRLQAVGEITCDKEGAIQLLQKYTTPEQPVFYYSPLTETISDDWKPDQSQVMVLAIDYLPSLLPYDASVEFGKYLNKIVPEIALSDPTKPLEQQGLPKYLENAVITCHGSLTPNFDYIIKLRKFNEEITHKPHFQPQKALKKVQSFFAFKVEGHLFDTGAINKMLDTIEQCELKFNIVDVKVGINAESSSSAVIQLFSKYPELLHETLQQVKDICDQFSITLTVDF